MAGRALLAGYPRYVVEISILTVFTPSWYLLPDKCQAFCTFLCKILCISSAAEIRSPGRQMRPMNPQGDPRSYHSWSVWRPMDYLGFCRKCFVMKVERRFYRCTDIKCPLCLSKMRTLFGPFWPFFYWLHGLSRLLIDHPTINHRWSVRRARILHFLQHCISGLNINAGPWTFNTFARDSWWEICLVWNFEESVEKLSVGQ